MKKSALLIALSLAGFTSCKKNDPPTITLPEDLPTESILPVDTIVTPSILFEHEKGLSEIHVWLGDAQGNYLPEFGDSTHQVFEHKTSWVDAGIAIIVPTNPVSEAWLYGRAKSNKNIEATASLKLYFQ